MIIGTFEIFGDKITIYENNKMDDLGKVYFELNRIEIRTKDVCRSEIIDSIAHEIVHVVFHKLAYHNLCYNEKLVDQSARSLVQILKTLDLRI